MPMRRKLLILNNSYEEKEIREEVLASIYASNRQVSEGSLDSLREALLAVSKKVVQGASEKLINEVLGVKFDLKNSNRDSRDPRFLHPATASYFMCKEKEVIIFYGPCFT